MLSFFALSIGLVSCLSEETGNSIYYIDSNNGDDNNTGTSINKSWRSLDMVNEVILKPGDQVLMAAGSKFTTPLIVDKINGTADQPILFTSHGDGEPVQINTKGHLNAIRITNSSYVEISNISVSAIIGREDNVSSKKTMRCGVLIQTTETGQYNHIYLQDLIVKDVFYESEGYVRPGAEVNTANGTQNYGWGIRVINNTDNTIINDLRIDGCRVENVAHTGIKLTSRRKTDGYGITNLSITNCEVFRTGGPGIQMSGVQHGHIAGNIVDKSGSADDSRKWGRGSGLWTWGSDRVLIEKNRFTNANGPKDSAGAHIDFNCSNVVLQYNFSAYNAGGFCEILGNNYNCSYRYNISVNDGHRVKGTNGAKQEGKIFWLSGFNGKKGTRNGPINSYFYNNSIYVSKDIESKIAIDRVANGVLIANNIFHLEGKGKVVKGDQWNPQTEGEWKVTDVFFTNNLFVNQSTWPASQRLQDKSPLFGDADFVKPGGLSFEDYIPQNIELIKNRGVMIPVLSQDTIGIVYGLEMEHDILGNPIIGTPDIGAIEIEK